MVPRKGLEPLHLWGQRILSPPCLPFHHLGINLICNLHYSVIFFLRALHSLCPGVWLQWVAYNEARISAHLPFHHLDINLICNLHYVVMFSLCALHSLCSGVWLQWVTCNTNSYFVHKKFPCRLCYYTQKNYKSIFF